MTPGLPVGWARHTAYSIRSPGKSISKATVGGQIRYTAWRLNPKTSKDKYTPIPTLLGTDDSLAGAIALFTTTQELRDEPVADR